MSDYFYADHPRDDILRMVPADGRVIGSIGCGTAANESELQKQGREVHGVDVHAPSIEVAKTRITSARVVLPDERDLFERESLDGLILADVIEHLPYAWERFKQFASFVKPGGWVVISVPNMRSIWAMRQFAIKGDWPEDEIGIFDRTHLQVMSRKRLDRWIGDAGLTVEARFDRRPSSKTVAARALRLLDALTLRRFESWLQFQVQVRCRKPR